MKFNVIAIVSVMLLGISATACASNTDKPLTATSPSKPEQMTVYKSPTCGCCRGWISYIEKAGYAVDAIDSKDMESVKARLGLTNPALKSCHTAIIGGYIIEGHVPAADIKRLLKERPDIAGLTAPGMPMMSPGMASEIPKDYDVLAFDENGNSYVFSSY